MALSVKSRLVAVLMAIGVALGGTIAASPAANAYGTTYPGLDFYATGSSTKWRVKGKAYFGQEYWCGIQRCSRTGYAYVRVDPLTYGPYTSNLVQAKTSFSYSGWNLNVTVGYKGIDFGFTDGGSTCLGSWFQGGSTSVYVDMNQNDLCQAAATDISSGTQSISGGIRVGSTWTIRSTSLSVPV